ncbi:MAG TPA: ester cyclase [Candidatus Dormibacteraeota bacterium]|nr:ester cyclase [Candidatus Dormibacteraeota bacterium]
MTDAKTLVREMFEDVINNGNVDNLERYFHPDFVDHGPLGDVVGLEAFRALVLTWRSAFPDVHCEVRNLFQEGDLVGWTVHTTGTHTGDGMGFPATGRRIDTVSANIGRARDGRAVEHWAEQGMLATLQQLGIIPPMPLPTPA